MPHRLPAVDRLLKHDALKPLVDEHGHERVARWIRECLASLREQLRTGKLAASREELIDQAAESVCLLAEQEGLEQLEAVINATGVVLHTNLGRAPLADRAIQAVQEAARYTSLEMDLASGKRRYRGFQLDRLWGELTGAEASLVVNNCASATLLTLQTLGAGKEVVVSRGQLIEIGGSYRLPDVFRQSGAILREVGTTNRTRLSDYESALGPETAGFLRVHQSNYRITGFTESVAIGPLAQLAHRAGVLAVDDIGSGCLLDLSSYGLRGEPTVGESIRGGADIVLFSGDKLFGGPQCGVILGKEELIHQIRKSPLARALRIDKLTLAALQATLKIHLAGRSLQEIPVLRQLTRPPDELETQANQLIRRVTATGAPLQLHARPGTAAIGGGSLPEAELPTRVVAVRAPGLSAEELSRRLRIGRPHVVGRIEKDHVLLDMRTVLAGQQEPLARALCQLDLSPLG